jgi:hypothetical protein
VWEDGLAAFEGTLGRVHMECNTEHTRSEAFWQDYLAWMHSFTTSSRCSFNFDQVLEESRTFLSIQEMNLGRWEEKLMEEHAHDLHSFNRWDLLAGLEELHSCMAEIEDECATEAVRLSRLAMEIPDALIDLGVFPIWDIPLLLESAQEVFASADLILECLREEHASDAGP